MQRIVLAGNGIAAKVIAAYLSEAKTHEVVAAVVDDQFFSADGESFIPTVQLSAVTSRFPPAVYRIIMAVGYSDLNRGRSALFERLKGMGYQSESWISPHASVAESATIGEGCLILPGSVVEPFAQVGVNTVLWSNVTVAHNSSVGSHCWLASGSVVSGQAKVGDFSFLGVNSTIVNNVEVGEGCFIGAGALVAKGTERDTVHISRGSEPLRYSATDYVKHFLR